ncbi:MAG: hypothetical protein JXA25_02815 [Anaerolineales bacterium]|nr:hypothetical protein [Anaerolineales bacterium]
MSDPLDELLVYAERSYIRMEAEQIISECLRIGDESDFNHLIQRLFLAGSSSIGILRDILEEIRIKKNALNKESLGVRQGLLDSMVELGVDFPLSFLSENPEHLFLVRENHLFEDIASAAPMLDERSVHLVQDICRDARDRIRILAKRLSMLNTLERTVRDWMSSLAYQATRSRDDNLRSHTDLPM